MDRKPAIRAVAALAATAATVAVAVAVRAGHEMPVYPSYYPQEIRIEAMAPAAAAEALAKTRIQAYVGALPPPGPEAKAVRAVDTLGAYLVVRVNPARPAASDKDGRCAVAAGVVAGLADGAGFRRHPYPVTPFHADYFHHADKARAAIARADKADAGALKVRAAGALAARLVEATAAGDDWDATLEEIAPESLLKPHRLDLNGWSGPAWLKDGWFHAHLLLADNLADADARARARTMLERLQRDDQATPEERVNLERDLVGMLTGDCRVAVAGYAVKRQYYTAEYSNGVENIGYDSIDGFNSAIFVRTVKLKDFPWNGWLTLGVEQPPKAAWNPIAGFTDETGRLIWHALGDPAFFPEPYGDGWSMNRIGDVKRTPK